MDEYEIVNGAGDLCAVWSSDEPPGPGIPEPWWHIALAITALVGVLLFAVAVFVVGIVFLAKLPTDTLGIVGFVTGLIALLTCGMGR